MRGQSQAHILGTYKLKLVPRRGTHFLGVRLPKTGSIDESSFPYKPTK